MRRFAVLPGLTAGLLAGLLVAAPLKRLTGAPLGPQSDSPRFDLERLSDAELETLALDALTKLDERGGAAAFKGPPGREVRDPRRIHLGIDNVRRLLPLGKRLTLQALGRLKTSGLSRERRLIASVRRVMIDPSLGYSAAVSEDDLSTIRVGPGYAAYLTSDDEAVLLLGHELTHVAARGGRLQSLIESVGRVARQSAELALGQVQKEELACDFMARRCSGATSPCARRAGRAPSALRAPSGTAPAPNGSHAPGKTSACPTTATPPTKSM